MDTTNLNENKQYYRLEKSEVGIDLYNYYYANNRRYKKRLFGTWDSAEDGFAEICDIKSQIQKQII